MRAALLSWYDANHRVLPWRRNAHSRLPADAVAAAAAAGQLPAPADLPQERFIYYVWVCEIMSQQTQVSRAAEYFRRWVARWPDVAALAAASQEEVNEVWAGLGYYRRARFLLDGARYVAGDLGGAFPRTAAELQKIPGVGAYTSAAIASIACGERSAVVDGNVVRVLARLRRLGGDPKSGGMVKLWAALAAQALDPARPGDFNQAVMELGATVCVPNTRPDCAACPVEAWCAARAAERAGGAAAPAVTDYPAKVERAEKREERVAVAVVRLVGPGARAADPGEGRLLLVKRPPGGLLAGLWEFPLQPVGAEAGGGEVRGVMDAYLEELLGARLVAGGEEGGGGGGGGEEGAEGGGGAPALRVVLRQAAGEVVHVFSHIRMTMVVENIVLQGELPPQPAAAAAAEAEAEGEAEGEGEGAGDDAPQGSPSPAKGKKAKGAKKAEAVAAGPPETQWLSPQEVEAKGLSSGVKKVYKLCTAKPKPAAPAGGGILKFFKPAGAS
jgi:A/G-specific adenine glycosylase